MRFDWTSHNLNKYHWQSTEPLGGNCRKIQKQWFLLKKLPFKMSSVNCLPLCVSLNMYTHWGRVTHICVSQLTIIGSNNGLSPGRRQAIIRTNAGILLIRSLGTNFSEILNENHTFSFKKRHLKMSSAKWWPFCLGLNVLSEDHGSNTNGNNFYCH